MARKNNGEKFNFSTISRMSVPQGRNGKHKVVVDRILSDLDQLETGRAMRIPLDELGDTKENIRAALSRATRKRDLQVATVADTGFLYIWRKGALERKVG